MDPLKSKLRVLVRKKEIKMPFWTLKIQIAYLKWRFAMYIMNDIIM